MSLIDQIIKGKRLTADFLYQLAYGLANGDLDTTNNNLTYFRSKSFADHVMDGCIWTGDAYASTRYASMSAGVVCIGGKVVSVNSVANRQFTASKDTYVDVDNNGVLYYTEVSNNTISPALTTGRIRLAIVVTGASNIANKYSINIGNLSNTNTEAYLPTTGVSLWTQPGGSVTYDAYGNIIRPTNPDPKMVAAYTRYGTATTGSPGGSAVTWNGLNFIVFQAEANTNYELVMHEPALSGATGNDNLKFVLYLSATAAAFTTLVNESNYFKVSGNAGVDLVIPFNSGAYSGKTYLELKFANTGFAGTMTMNSDTARGAIYTIKKV